MGTFGKIGGVSSPLWVGDEYAIRWSDADCIIIINESIIRLSSTEYTLFRLFLERMVRLSYNMVIPIDTLLAKVYITAPENSGQGIKKVPSSMVSKISRLRRRIGGYFIIQNVMRGGMIYGYQMTFVSEPASWKEAAPL